MSSPRPSTGEVWRHHRTGKLVTIVQVVDPSPHWGEEFDIIWRSTDGRGAHQSRISSTRFLRWYVRHQLAATAIPVPPAGAFTGVESFPLTRYRYSTQTGDQTQRVSAVKCPHCLVLVLQDDLGEHVLRAHGQEIRP